MNDTNDLHITRAPVGDPSDVFKVADLNCEACQYLLGVVIAARAVSQAHRNDLQEARALVTELLGVVASLADQHAMPDNHYLPAMDKAIAYLTRTSP